MTLFRPLSLISLAFFGLVVPSSATITFLVNIDQVYDASTNPVGAGAKYILVADTNNDGFVGSGGTLNAPTVLSPGNTLEGTSDDLILYQGDFSAFGGFGAGADAGATPPLALGGGWTTGDALAVYWFPTGNAGAGDTFGFYTDPTIPPAIPVDNIVPNYFITPADGALSHDLRVYSTNPSFFVAGAAGSNSPASLSATGTVIPESSALSLIGLAVGMLLFRRRR